MSETRYVPPLEPLSPAAHDALRRFLDGQSLIRAAYQVGMQEPPWPGAAERTSDVVWLDIAGRRRGRVARRALSMGIRPNLMPVLRPGLRWSLVTQRALRDAGAAAHVLWRAPQRVLEGLDPLAFDLTWRPLRPPPGFVEAASIVPEGCDGIQRAVLTEEVLLNDGAEVSSHAHIYFRELGPAMAPGGGRRADGGLWPRVEDVGVGRAPVFPLTSRRATEIFRRGGQGVG